MLFLNYCFNIIVQKSKKVKKATRCLVAFYSFLRLQLGCFIILSNSI